MTQQDTQLVFISNTSSLASKLKVTLAWSKHRWREVLCRFCGSTQVYATAADIEATLSLPASPRLILHGIHFI
ncbi:hypothetical protein ILYODFUR_037246 [Ilyodon furcidens]|uniref:Uncharacterized protein n=1 Tax=Ilyodon furcidens TaxID=33524 RepID=A0ABV0ST37_9TELE